VRNSDNQSARRVVEEPKGSPIPYLAAATVAAVAVWSWQQQPSADEGAQSRSEPKIVADRSSAPHGAKGDLRRLFSADDYPAAAARKGEEGTVQAVLTVSAEGRVTACRIIRTSGSASLDDGTCRILQRRARFIPAQDINGNAVPDEVTTPPIVWRLEG
jgi:protein TonB